MLQWGGPEDTVAYRTFGGGALPDGNLYCSFLLNCAQLPSTSQFVLALVPAGTTSANPPDDTVDFYFTFRTNGYTCSVAHAGSDRASARTLLGPARTHFIVLKYTDGLGSRCRMYLDPPLGGAEPATPSAATEADDGAAVVAGTPVSQLGTLVLSAVGDGAGLFQLDSLRIGTQWSDVAPSRIPLTVTGPADAAICAGLSAVFNVAATGTPPFGYQWRSNGVAIPGATNSVLSLVAPGPADALSSYNVVVTDANGSVTSGAARLNVSHGPPVITSSPVSAFIPAGSANATFSVAVSGDGALGLQWRTNGIAIPGATNSALTLLNPALADTLSTYDVVAANPCGSVASAPVQLMFLHQFLICDALPGFFSGMNLFTTNGPGRPLFVWSSADPAQPLTSWFLEGQLAEQPLNDGTGNSRYSLNVNPLSSPMYYVIGEANSGPYLTPVPVQVITTDSFGNYGLLITNASNISPAGVLSWTSTPGLPTLTLQPAANGMQLSGSGVPGAVYWLQASASLSPAVWVTVATNLADASGAVSFSDPGSNRQPRRFYRLATPGAPVFLRQPQSSTGQWGQPATFSASVAGASPLSYQWYFMGAPLAGATTATLTLPNPKPANAGVYTLVAANSFGSVTSSPAVLTLSSPAILPPAQ